MEHVAIMRKSWGLLEKIVTGEKKIESRWYKFKRKPWDAVKSGDTVYFKNSGEPVTLKTTVGKVLQFEVTPLKVKQIIKEYGARDGICVTNEKNFYEFYKDRKYCLLIFLKNPVKIKPFEIDKTGFGAMEAWILVDDINKIKTNVPEKNDSQGDCRAQRSI